MAAYKNKKWTRKRVTRKRIVDKGVNSKGNKYTVYTDGSYRYDNAHGDYHYSNSDGSTYTKRGNQDYYTAPNGRKSGSELNIEKKSSFIHHPFISNLAFRWP